MGLTNAPSLILLAGVHEASLANVLKANGFTVVQPPTGALALDWARDVQPDTIIASLDACRLLRGDPRIGHDVPILILTPDRPTPEQRVSALGAGAWDFLRHPGDIDELLLRLETYRQAKRNLDLALADRLVDPATGLHNRASLARRAQELGALMARQRAGLACVVFAFDPDSDPADSRAGRLLTHAARLSDVVGTLAPSELALLAPATRHAGAVKLAERVGGVLRRAIDGGVFRRGSTLRAGYDAVANLTYRPMDPVELLMHASAALRAGTPEPGRAWVRRYDGGAADRDVRSPPRPTEPMSDKGKSVP
jgi:DNA-binding response OmpR family regulator